MELPFLVTPEKRNGNNKQTRWVSEQTNKMRTKPVPQHIVQNSCGTKDTEGQRTLRDKGH